MIITCKPKIGSAKRVNNNFFAQFPTEVVDNTGSAIAITAQAQGLPQMNGAGMVRDMRAAASLDGGFAAALTAFAAGTTRDAQRGMLDDLLTKWADTSSCGTGLLGTSVPSSCVNTYVQSISASRAKASCKKSAISRTQRSGMTEKFVLFRSVKNLRSN